MSETLELNGKNYIGVLSFDCRDCDLSNKGVCYHNDPRCSNSNLMWKEVKNINNNSDLSNVKVGDYIWTIQSGWTKVVDVNTCITHPISCDNRYSYDTEGKVCGMDSYPSAFINPPKCFCGEPKPCEFKKGDMVIVGYNINFSGNKRYFSHYEEDDNSYHCYSDGGTEWSSNGETSRWHNCKKA